MDTKEKFIQLRAGGLSFDKISKKLNVSKPTLIEWSKELRTEIANLKAIELEALQEKYYISKKKRIELLGSQLDKVNKELEKRKLSEIPTDKLLDHKLKLVAELKREEIPLKFTDVTIEDNCPFDLTREKVTTWEG